MKRLLLVVAWVALLVVAVARPVPAAPRSRAQAIADATTELDVEGARKLLELRDSDSPTLAFERARLAIYVGDCDAAAAILSGPELGASPEGSALAELSRSCARATAGSVVVEERDAGVWIRLQDEADRALVPFLTEVAVAARAQMAKDLGVELPRPLRIDLVRDLFSLSAVSGLPLAAAETTGTVAVARWGRVSMISPRATPLGYPWEDTLAHEIAHLALSRASRDNAPLWLQEGIAKREETRWRAERPFDRTPSVDRTAKQALRSGRSVGVDKLGPSIAMLPTPEAASTAFAEVTSFVDFWIRENGDAALRLLLADLRGLGSEDPSAALRSVTGYDLSGWVARWQRRLLASPDEPEAAHPALAKGARTEDVARRVRLGDLLFASGHSAAAATQLEGSARAAAAEPALRWRWARALADAGRSEDARTALGSLSELRGSHGAWQALNGRFLSDRGDRAGAQAAFRLGTALDPWLEDVACEGHWTSRSGGAAPPTPAIPRSKALCEAARLIPRD